MEDNVFKVRDVVGKGINHRVAKRLKIINAWADRDRAPKIRLGGEPCLLFDAFETCRLWQGIERQVYFPRGAAHLVALNRRNKLVFQMLSSD